MMLDVVYWATAAASLVAVWLNIRKRVACFVIWTATNATWAIADLYHGLPQQAALQAVYFALSIWGFLRWRAEASTAKEVPYGKAPS